MSHASRGAEAVSRLPRRVVARVSHWFSGVGFVAAFVLALYMLWKIVRTPGELRRLRKAARSARVL